MQKYRIGITEAGDAGVDLSWQKKIGDVDGAVLITKCFTPSFCHAVLQHEDKLIVHATITGFGGTVLEPNVPRWDVESESVCQLVDAGFPKEKVVIRVDPIIPTEKGVNTARRVITSFLDRGFARFRISLIDMYPHVRNRFKNAGIPLPYGESGFAPDKYQIERVNQMLRSVKDYASRQIQIESLRIEACAEPGLSEAIQCGCISGYDLELLGLHDEQADQCGFQRKNCMCYSGKTELLSHKRPCQHGCLYCYWKTEAGIGEAY